jgi:type II secretory pathway component PulF
VAIFRYEAADLNGKVLRGAMDAPTADEVARRLQGRGYRTVRVQAPPTIPAQTRWPRAADLVQPRGPRGLSFARAVAPEDLGLFFRQMASLLHAGFTPAGALADLGPRTAHRGIRTAAAAMAAAAAAGQGLSSEMARFPALFAPHVVGLVAAGETGGFLPFAFEEAALGAEQDAALRQGLWLPRLLIWQAVWSVLLLQPLFPRIFTEGPAAYLTYVATRMLPLGVGLHLSVGLLGWLWRQPFAAAFRDRAALALPVMRRLARRQALAAFTRVLRRLLLAGIAPEPAFLGAARAVPNRVLAARFATGASSLRDGRGLDAAVEATGMMEHDPLQMLVTGQRTGQWAEMLERVTAYYQEEAAAAILAAKAAQKRIGVLVTIVATGYVTIVATVGPMQAAFQFTDKLFGE